MRLLFASAALCIQVGSAPWAQPSAVLPAQLTHGQLEQHLLMKELAHFDLVTVAIGDVKVIFSQVDLFLFPSSLHHHDVRKGGLGALLENAETPMTRQIDFGSDISCDVDVSAHPLQDRLSSDGPTGSTVLCVGQETGHVLICEVEALFRDFLHRDVADELLCCRFHFVAPQQDSGVLATMSASMA